MIKGDGTKELQLGISRFPETREKVALEEVPQALNGVNSDSETRKNEILRTPINRTADKPNVEKRMKAK